VFHEQINTKNDEIVLVRVVDSFSLVVQSRARGYDDYHLSQGSTTMTREQAVQLYSALGRALNDENNV
jgi:hypothetical protein